MLKIFPWNYHSSTHSVFKEVSPKKELGDIKVIELDCSPL